jgi:hypothetical protein
LAWANTLYENLGNYFLFRQLGYADNESKNKTISSYAAFKRVLPSDTQWSRLWLLQQYVGLSPLAQAAARLFRPRSLCSISREAGPPGCRYPRARFVGGPVLALRRLAEIKRRRQRDRKIRPSRDLCQYTLAVVPHMAGFPASISP